jgi:hypothetical protein
MKPLLFADERFLWNILHGFNRCRPSYLINASNAIDELINLGDINILQIRIKLAYVFKTSDAYVETACFMVVNFNVKVIHLIKAYTKAPVTPLGKKNSVGCKYLGFSHSIHKIEFPYIHKAVFCVLVPGSAKIDSNHIPIFQKEWTRMPKYQNELKWRSLS